MSLVGLAGSHFGFSVIVSVLYPVIGYLGFVILLILFYNYMNMCLKKIVSVRMCRFYLNKGVQVRPVLSLVPPLKGAENR